MWVSDAEAVVLRLYGWPPDAGHRVSVRYDSYFGILAFEDLDVSQQERAKANTSYVDGVFTYAQPKHTIHRNYHAHWMLFVLLVV